MRYENMRFGFRRETIAETNGKNLISQRSALNILVIVLFFFYFQKSNASFHSKVQVGKKIYSNEFGTL